MGYNSSVAANLKPEQRKQLFIEMQSSSQQITAIAKREGVSRKFLYQQQQKGNQALEKEFNQSKEESEILYWIPVTKQWIFQVILGLIFICHSSYRGVVEFLRDLLDYQRARCYSTQSSELSGRKSPKNQSIPRPLRN